MKRTITLIGRGKVGEVVELTAKIRLPNGHLTKDELGRVVGGFSDQLHRSLREGGAYGVSFYSHEIEAKK